MMVWRRVLRLDHRSADRTSASLQLSAREARRWHICWRLLVALQRHHRDWGGPGQATWEALCRGSNGIGWEIPRPEGYPLFPCCSSNASLLLTAGVHTWEVMLGATNYRTFGLSHRPDSCLKLVLYQSSKKMFYWFHYFLIPMCKKRNTVTWWIVLLYLQQEGPWSESQSDQTPFCGETACSSPTCPEELSSLYYLILLHGALGGSNRLTEQIAFGFPVDFCGFPPGTLCV